MVLKYDYRDPAEDGERTPPAGAPGHHAPGTEPPLSALRKEKNPFSIPSLREVLFTQYIRR